MSKEPTSLSYKNQVFFDSLASALNRPAWMNDLVNQIQTEVVARLDCFGIPSLPEQTSDNVRLLDYACGAGELSRTLFPYVNEAKGIDVSATMVKAYNDHAHAARIPEEEMCAVQGDMLATNMVGEAKIPFANKEWFGFDLAVMSMALHHVAPPEEAIKKLVERLKEGGILIIIDWELSSIVFHEAGHPTFSPGDHGSQMHDRLHGHAAILGHAHNLFPGSEHTITRAGFGKEEMERMLADAGCEDVEFMKFKDQTRLGDGEQAVMQRLFLAKGRKSETKV